MPECTGDASPPSGRHEKAALRRLNGALPTVFHGNRAQDFHLRIFTVAGFGLLAYMSAS